MTVLSRGARVRRGGRRPGWVLLTALLVLAMGASSALVFTNRVELLKLAVILALWAAVAGAFVSVLYRRQSDADQSRARDLKLVYDLQLDREISARREYELTVESQLRRELASELRAQAADDVAALRAELAALRTSLEILFDTDLDSTGRRWRPRTETPPRAYSDWDAMARARPSTGCPAIGSPRSARTTRPAAAAADEAAIIDVPEEPLVPPPAAARIRRRGNGSGSHQTCRQRPPTLAPRSRRTPATRPPAARAAIRAAATGRRTPAATTARPPPQPEPQPQPQPQDWQPVAADGQWLPPGAPGSHWAGVDSPSAQRAAARAGAGAPGIPAPTKPAATARRSSPRTSIREATYGDIRSPGALAPFGGVPRLSRRNFAANRAAARPRPRHAAAPAAPPAAAPPPRRRHRDWRRRRRPSPHPGTAARTREPDGTDHAGSAQTGGQSVADLWRGCRSSRPGAAGVVAVRAELTASLGRANRLQS